MNHRKSTALIALATLLTGLDQFFFKATTAGDQDLREALKMEEIRKKALLNECIILEKRYLQLDLFASQVGSTKLGLDLRGNVWNFSRDSQAGCSLQSSYRLDKPSYEVNFYGKKIWKVFHYEDPMLCEYTREATDTKVRRRCLVPTGIVNKFAPYFKNS